MKGLEAWMLGYLVNAAWQVPVLFASAWAVARWARRIGAEAEHRVWVAALMLEAVVPACTVRPEEILRTVWALLHGHHAGQGEVRITMGAGMVGGGVMQLPAWVLTGVIAAYAGCTAYFALRLMWGLWQTRRMAREAELLPLEGEAEQVWRLCGERFGVQAEIAVSREMSGPVTVGRTVIVPVGFFERVRGEDWKAAAAHEMAHVRRRDFAKNLAYGVVSLPVAWHPLLWRTRVRLEETREMVCDAMAAGTVAGRESYARSLIRLAALVAEGAPVRTFHAIGIFDANSFERRVMRLTEKGLEMKGVRRVVTAAACVVIGLATCASAMALRMEVVAPVQAAQNGAHAVLTVDPKVMAGQVISRVNPVYPPEAKANKDTVSGPVVLHVIIGKDGSVREIQVKKSLRKDYDLSALKAVSEWKYKPYLLNGNPTEVDTTVTVNYSTVE